MVNRMLARFVDHTLRRDRLAAERELRAMAAEQDAVVWIRHDWLDSLGRDRINAILGEYGYPPARGWGNRYDLNG